MAPAAQQLAPGGAAFLFVLRQCAQADARTARRGKAPSTTPGETAIGSAAGHSSQVRGSDDSALQLHAAVVRRLRALFPSWRWASDPLPSALSFGVIDGA